MSAHHCHPLKWLDLVEQVKRSGMENPDVWIEDVREYGVCVGEAATLVDAQEGTLAIEASFSPICDPQNNRVTVRHHF